ncbi:MAG: aminotransferase class I/II-fold pyridoxal phosphate-dependent enzyme [Pseudomonadota bacterium]
MTSNPVSQTSQSLQARYAELQGANYQLDLTRGKPSPDQLALANALDGILDGDYAAEDGTDVRGYGGLDGIAEAKRLGGWLLDMAPERVLVGGNSSLTLMYQALLFANQFGFDGPGSAWRLRAGQPKIICPVPGYDRHFAICESLGIDMLNVPMGPDGPDLDAIESILAVDDDVCGMFAVPKFSNPGGEVYADSTVRRLAEIVAAAPPYFRLIWDNAYAVHGLDKDDVAPPVLNIASRCEALGAGDRVLSFASTSKVTFAGAGLAFLGASPQNLADFSRHLAISTIGPDKVNQLRHARFLPNREALLAHMAKQAAILKPKFDLVEAKLDAAFGADGRVQWTRPGGGYFVSFFTEPGLASRVVTLASDAGVKLTPAGAAYPYGYDPEDRHIRLAPSFPSLDELERAMDVFVVCVALASGEQTGR